MTIRVFRLLVCALIGVAVMLTSNSSCKPCPPDFPVITGTNGKITVTAQMTPVTIDGEYTLTLKLIGAKPGMELAYSVLKPDGTQHTFVNTSQQPLIIDRSGQATVRGNDGQFSPFRWYPGYAADGQFDNETSACGPLYVLQAALVDPADPGNPVYFDVPFGVHYPPEA